MGITSDMASSISNFLRIASAVIRLSPVSITTFRPTSLNCFSADLLESLMVSATAMMPSSSPSFAKSRGVFPSFARLSSFCLAVFCMSSFLRRPFSCKKARFPARYFFPSTTALTPRPARASKLSAWGTGSFFSLAFSTTAIARGCSLPDSTAAASARKVSWVIFLLKIITSVTEGCPEVIVPVLSSTMVSMECRVSRLSADFIRMPYSAAFPVPTIIATGVARPRAQGQEITSTAIALERANSKVWPVAIQAIAVRTAITITVGTKIPLTRSARRAMGALVLPASSTRRMICARVVSSPTLDARKRKVPFLLMVAEITSSPGSFSTGILSPVMAAWST